MKTILVATDLTARSDRALARGLALAQACGAALHVVHVVDQGLPAPVQDHALEWARGTLAREVAVHGPPPAGTVQCHVLAGKPRRDVVAQAEALGAELIVLGLPASIGHFRSPFAESTAGQILKASPLPVLLARMPVQGAYRQLVVGVDFSIFSRAALRLAQAVAPGAALHLVHAYTVPYRAHLGTDYRQELSRGECRSLDAFLVEEVALLNAHVRGLGVPVGTVTTELHEGGPFDVLTEACRRHGVELLVLGTHGRTGVSRLFWGSVAEALLDAPPCDVLVARVG